MSNLEGDLVFIRERLAAGNRSKNEKAELNVEQSTKKRKKPSHMKCGPGFIAPWHFGGTKEAEKGPRYFLLLLLLRLHLGG